MSVGDIKHSLCVCGINIKSSCAYTKTNSSKGGILYMVWLLLGLPLFSCITGILKVPSYHDTELIFMFISL